MTQPSDLLAQIRTIGQLAAPHDIEVITTYMRNIRNMGIAPSDTVDRGLKYSENYVQYMYPEMNILIRLELAVYICKQASLEVGVHSETKRKQKLEEKQK